MSTTLFLFYNFNMGPIKKNKGVLFLSHIAKKFFSPTKGCVAIKKSDMIKILKFVNKKTLVNIS